MRETTQDTDKKDQESWLCHTTSCRNKWRWPGWSPHPSLLEVCLAWERAGKSQAWHQLLRATSLPWAAEGPQAELCCLGLCPSTDGVVNLKYSTRGRQMGGSREDLEPGIWSGGKRAPAAILTLPFLSPALKYHTREATSPWKVPQLCSDTERTQAPRRLPRWFQPMVPCGDVYLELSSYSHSVGDSALTPTLPHHSDRNRPFSVPPFVPSQAFIGYTLCYVQGTLSILLVVIDSCFA
jgi:hypothetical protein